MIERKRKTKLTNAISEKETDILFRLRTDTMHIYLHVGITDTITLIFLTYLSLSRGLTSDSQIQTTN